MGTANKCDFELLQPGQKCIIEVNDVNSPTGIWWGEVVVVADRDTFLSVSARITGGRFALDGGHEPILSDENRNRVLTGNCRVYPDTETVRMMLRRRLRCEEDLRQAEARAVRMKQLFLETMAHLVRDGVVRKEEEEAAKKVAG